MSWLAAMQGQSFFGKRREERREVQQGNSGRRSKKATVDTQVEYMPSGSILREGSVKYLPGDQRRRVVLTSRKLCLGLENEEVMLDYIPLHEIVEVTHGGIEVSRGLFDTLDEDGDGLLTPRELQEGLQRYGFGLDECLELFFPDFHGVCLCAYLCVCVCVCMCVCLSV